MQVPGDWREQGPCPLPEDHLVLRWDVAGLPGENSSQTLMHKTLKQTALLLCLWSSGLH